jgi:hypothetical protein
VGPQQVSLRLDWTDELEARLAAHRGGAPSVTPAPEAPPEPGGGGDLPPALAAMMQDRRDDHVAAVEAARMAAIAAIPTQAWREIEARASSIGATAELLQDGGEIRIVLPLEDATVESSPVASA